MTQVGTSLLDLMARVQEYATKEDGPDTVEKYDVFMAYTKQEAVFLQHRLKQSTPSDHMDILFLVPWLESIQQRIDDERLRIIFC
jgi:hypothetical protein